MEFNSTKPLDNNDIDEEELEVERAISEAEDHPAAAEIDEEELELERVIAQAEDNPPAKG